MPARRRASSSKIKLCSAAQHGKSLAAIIKRTRAKKSKAPLAGITLAEGEERRQRTRVKNSVIVSCYRHIIPIGSNSELEMVRLCQEMKNARIKRACRGWAKRRAMERHSVLANGALASMPASPHRAERMRMSGKLL